MKKNKQKVFFDREYYIDLEGITKEDCRFKIRVEGYVDEESDTQCKVKTKRSFWSGYDAAVTYIEYPKNSFARENMSKPNIVSHYWLDKTNVTLIK